MKTKLYVISMAALSAALAHAIPQSPVVAYGLVRDEYGNPFTDSGALSLRLVKASEADDGQVYAAANVGTTPYPGMNYRVSLEIDSTGPERPYAVLEGTEMKFRFLIGGDEQTATPTPVFAVPKNGTAMRLDYALGEDADGDGLPDAWEEWVLEIAGLAHDAAAIDAFNPDDDGDGDGMSNYREFLAGTDPFLATDLLEITAFSALADTGRTEIKFTTVPGRSYRIVTTGSLASPTWIPVATSRSADGALAYETYQGTGRTITLYLDTPDASSAFFRIAAN